ncbi:hypothetical protein NE237_025859 [Protea cynaroides]|uniref:Retroviral polymerase SH3-like domain-containing protein n=1 Tax=Protea cynaroides TaxID=273540 RepID=A0A9Q0H5N2_9MAGN|nr:hypothetical protein NE237_025859 [Protea cynaroides]
MNRTLMDHARSMLSCAGIEQMFWAEAVCTAYYVVNRSPTTALDRKFSDEIWYGKPVDYSFFHTFGCDAYMWVLKELRTKLDARSRKCIFLGYAAGIKGYRLWDPTTHKLVINRDVVFNEDSLQKDKETSSSNLPQMFEPKSLKEVQNQFEERLINTEGNEASEEHTEPSAETQDDQG